MIVSGVLALIFFWFASRDAPESVEGAERAAWYAYAVETWPRYGEYTITAAGHGREIPVFLLEPVD